MQRFSKLLLFLVFSVLLTANGYLLNANFVNAQVPQPRVPCGKDASPEFNSLRPYQASPCGDSNKAYYCGNDILIYEIAHHTETSRGNDSACQHEDWPVHQLVDKTYSIALKDMELPILGNTQDNFDDATKANEYVSSYLSGANAKKETGPSTDDQIVNYSGPVQKLLPSIIQDAQRIDTIESLTKTVNYVDSETVATGEQLKVVKDEPANHNQTVVCHEHNGVVAVPCPGGEELKLKDWDGDLGVFRSGSNIAIDLVKKIPVVGSLISNVVTDAWNKRTPPLPWDNGESTTEQKTPFKTDLDYLKAYNEWQGKSCVIIPVINRLFCFDNPLIKNYFADLYQYIPLSSTVDKAAKVPIPEGHAEVKPINNGTELSVDRPHSTILKEPVLYFAHTQEDAQLSSLLKKSFVPKNGTGKDIDPLTTEPDKNSAGQCNVINVRSNEGDNLFPEFAEGQYSVKVDPYYIERIPKSGECKPSVTFDKNRNRPVVTYSQDFEGGATVTIKTQTKTPNAEEIYKNTVAGSSSIFRKIYPKVEPGAPVECIANIPTVSNVNYEILGGTDEIKVTEPDGTHTDGTGSKLYFPYFGSVYEYFLKGIQTALRPKGYASPNPINGQYCADLNIKCGELPKTLPKASGSCNLGGISSKVGNIPQSLKDIINAAAQTYKVPPNLILGIMYGEGLFDGSNKKDWTDQNVKNWSTCQKVPSCSESGDDHFMGFNGNDWATVSKGIKADLKKLDPTRKDPDVCNLMDAVYGVAWNLHDSADGGGPSGGISCFGIPLKSSVPNSCTWNDNQYESAIKIAENGYDLGCFTLPGSCAGGGGNNALCTTGIDGCETLQNRGANSSHNACVWDVGHGK